MSQCGHHGAQSHSCTLTQRRRSRQHLENLYFHLISPVQQTCAAQCLLRDPLGTTQTEGVTQDQLLPIPSALVTALLLQPSSAWQWGLQLLLGLSSSSSSAECPGRGCTCIPLAPQTQFTPVTSLCCPGCICPFGVRSLSSGSSTAVSPSLPAPLAVPAPPGAWGRGFVVPCSVCTGCPSPLPRFTALEFQSNTHAKKTAINLRVSIKYCLF